VLALVLVVWAMLVFGRPHRRSIPYMPLGTSHTEPGPSGVNVAHHASHLPLSPSVGGGVVDAWSSLATFIAQPASQAAVPGPGTP